MLSGAIGCAQTIFVMWLGKISREPHNNTNLCNYVDCAFSFSHYVAYFHYVDRVIMWFRRVIMWIAKKVC